MLFSIIIPVYNVEDYLAFCLESIQKQTFTDFEVIMVDDGSDDHSGEICESFVSSDKRFHVIHKPNGGQSSARNVGTKHARGEYLVFIDSDDFLTGESCFKIIADNLKTRPDILVYKYFKYFSEDNRTDCGIDLSGLNDLDKLDLIKELIRRDSFFCSCWSKTVKRQLITDNKIVFDEALSCEDMDWYFNVIRKCSSIKAVDAHIINYRQRKNSVTSGQFKLKNLKDYIFTIEKWRNCLETDCNQENEILLNAIAKLYCNLLISYSKNKDKARETKPKIFRQKNLLKYNLNPRTAKFHMVTSLFGLNTLVQILYLISKLK